MKTFLGFITGILIGALGFGLCVIYAEGSPEYIDYVQRYLDI